MKRLFIPGSEWLYLKIYTGHKSADEIIVQRLHPVLESLQEQETIRYYFFIRYADPKFHIRLRMYLNTTHAFNDILAAMTQILEEYVENGIVWDIQCGTYKREVERYGLTTMEQAEKWFSIDSRKVLELLNVATRGLYPEQDRWRLALLLINQTLSMFNYDLEQKQKILKKMSDSYKHEFGFTHSSFTKQLSKKYRDNREIIESTLATTDEWTTTYKAIMDNYADEQVAIALDVIDRIATDEDFNNQFISSLMHMTMNRLFRSQNRIFELVIYDFLYRYYQSKIAQQKYKKL